jgi:hypothetical protein
VAILTLGREFKCGVLVFVGLKDVRFEPWPRTTATKNAKVEGRRARGKKEECDVSGD